MDVRNCRGCGRLFNYISGGDFLCPRCIEDLNKKFANVKEYIRTNPSASMPEIARENDVTVKQIERWVREERLYFSDDSPIGLECENCGAIIKTGRFCGNCKNTMQHNLGNAYEQAKPKPEKIQKEREKDKMRFLGD